MKTPNPGYDKTATLLREAGYDCIRYFEVKLPKGYLPSEDRFEVWAGSKGVLIAQVWRDGNGVHLYADWSLGSTLDQLKEAL